MAPSFEKIVASTVFTFFVGTERVPIMLHNALVADHSPTLNTMMNGEMSEAKNNQAHMLGIDVSTFVHFSKWLYTGRYDILYGEGNPQIFSEQEREPESHLHAWDYGLNMRQRQKRQRQMQLDGTWDSRVTQDEIDESITISATHLESAHPVRKQNLWKTFVQPLDVALAPPPRKNSRRISVNWAEILLGHARLYCFADMYGIVPLQNLCSDAVRAALIDFECEGDQVDALVQLVSYTVANTPSTNTQDAQSLRAIVLDFAVIVFEVLVVNESFNELLRTNNDLAVDLLSLLTKRLD